MKTSVLAVVIAPVPFLFNFIFLYTQVMLILIFMKAVFSFEKGWNGQNHSSGPTTL